jgi:hypothetical protein
MPGKKNSIRYNSCAARKSEKLILETLKSSDLYFNFNILHGLKLTHDPAGLKSDIQTGYFCLQTQNSDRLKQQHTLQQQFILTGNMSMAALHIYSPGHQCGI